MIRSADLCELTQIKTSMVVLFFTEGKSTRYLDCFLHYTGPILESKGMRAIFQKKGNKMFKKGKIFESLGKNVQNLKFFLKRAGHCV